MAATQDKEKNKSTLIVLNNFLHKNRIIFLVFIGVILIFTLGFIVFNETTSKITERSTLLAEEMEELFSQWQQLTDEDPSKAETETRILSLGDEIISKYPKRYAAQRAYLIKGDLFFEKGQWKPSTESYLTLSEKFPESYLSPVALMNAAAALEELEEYEDAAALYKKVSDYSSDFHPDVPRALFSLGRISETLGNREEALSAYNLCIDRFPSSSWTKLARDRIIYLNSR